MSWLIEQLQRRNDDRGVMANLRCALIENKEHRAWPALSRLGIGIEKKDDVLIAGLFAYHPSATNTGNFGETCRFIKDKLDKRTTDEKLTPVERRFQHLLAAEKSELGTRLRQFILLANKEGIPVNYDQLKRDLGFWGSKIKSEWAASFWNVVNSKNSSASEEV